MIAGVALAHREQVGDDGGEDGREPAAVLLALDAGQSLPQLGEQPVGLGLVPRWRTRRGFSPPGVRSSVGFPAGRGHFHHPSRSSDHRDYGRPINRPPRPDDR
jgi:hypothetical protein